MSSGGSADGTDPFDTAGLRRAVLEAWESSPTRFREDANAEEDLRLGGYRERLFVELAQNAADAAAAAERPGALRVEFEQGLLRVANTGVPLTADGVAALASLRASAKRTGTEIGRFGVGFAAVLSVSDEPAVVSTTGGVAFSAERTRAEAARLPGPDEELQRRQGAVPVLRLAWPADERPPEGFATEVRLPLRSDVDVEELRAALVEQVADLLLALPALREVRCGERVWHREDVGADGVVVHGPEGADRWLVHRESGAHSESAVSELGAEARHSARWRVCWAVPVDDGGAVLPLSTDVLHAPTPTEERLSLPARLLASVPLEADRRRVVSSTAANAVLAHAAECYPELLRKLAPEQRPALVPLPDFPLSDVDDRLRQAVWDRLRVTDWLVTAGGAAVAPCRAKVLDTPSEELVEALRGVLDGLLRADFSEARHRRALHAVEVPRLTAGDVVAAVSDLQREPTWWYGLYAALEPVERTDPHAREDLASLPVPLIDGRTVRGVRDVLLADHDDPEIARLLSELDISGLRIAHVDAVHPLLTRLGASSVDSAELLDAPALVDAVESSVADARSGVDTAPLAQAVLRLASLARERPWMGALALPDRDGEFRRADELLLPDAELLPVLDADVVGPEAALGVLDADVAAEWPRELLRSIGVLDTFSVHVEEEPTEPDEDFPDSGEWWRQCSASAETWPPARFVGIRDLDLVAANAWPRALRLLTSSPETAHALREPNNHAAWWIARYAVLGGRAPRFWRLPEATELTGLYDPVPDVGLSAEQLRLAGVRTRLRVVDTADAADLLQRLGDPERTVRAGTGLRAHQALADAVARGAVEPEELTPPEAVRSVSGATAPAQRAVVLDEPWMTGVLEPPLVVAGGSPDRFDADALAELLDLPLASEEDGHAVVGEGSPQVWREVARVEAACELLGLAVPEGEVLLHDKLTVRGSERDWRVHWWVDDRDRVHAERTADGLARALSWVAGCWHERFALAALLADPEAPTLLR
ncbi:molecular chaperone Hsp90 [Salinifilum aidingensis]